MSASARQRWIVPLGLFLAFLAIYGLTAGASLGRHSLAPHFVYLAEALLAGRLDLIHVPDPPYDLTLFDGRWYVSFPPLPALLMLPLVAVRGLAVSDIAFSVVIGAVNPSLFYLVLERLGIAEPRARIWSCLLLGLGTPLWYCAALGSVWFTAHVVAVACMSLYALEVLGKNRPVLAGLWLGLGFLSRPPTLLAFPLALVAGLRCAGGRQLPDPRVGAASSTRRARHAVMFACLLALGVAPALLGQAAYNWARFGNPLEFGYRWMNSPQALLERQAAWGQFSLHFLPENLYTLLVRPPLVSLAPFHVEPDPWGMGLLITCPVLLLALPREILGRIGQGLSIRGRANRATTSPSPGRPAACACEGRCSLRLGLWLSLALIQLPSLLYFNTGSYQFGYRFALDWLSLGIPLIALETGGRLRWWGKALILASALAHLWGVLWMYPNFNGQPWHLQYVDLLQQLTR